MENNKDIVNLFWTGGWDSTFRLLQLLLIEKKEVQPYYVKFPSRKHLENRVPTRRSTDKEIGAMDKIRRQLFKEYPFTKDLLRPTEYVEAINFKPGRHIKDSYRTIKNQKYIGQQYEALAAFAEKRGINDLELSVEMEGHSHDVIEPFVTKESSSDIYEIDQNRATKPIYNLYKNFRFPILKYTKNEIADISKKEGWIHIMKMTWFCHRPYFGRYPCGACNPCTSSHKHGMGWRLPFFSRIFGKTFKTIYHSKVMTKLRSAF